MQKRERLGEIDKEEGDHTADNIMLERSRPSVDANGHVMENMTQVRARSGLWTSSFRHGLFEEAALPLSLDRSGKNHEIA